MMKFEQIIDIEILDCDDLDCFFRNCICKIFFDYESRRDIDYSCDDH